MENLAVVSTIFWPSILTNLSIVSILFSYRKSNRCFNNFLAVDFSQSIRSFNIVFQMKNLIIVSTIFWPRILGNLSVVSICFSNGKSNHCFNNFLALDFSQSIHSFSIVFLNGKSNRYFNNILPVHFSQSIHSFNLQQFLALDFRQAIHSFNLYCKLKI